VLGDQFVKKDSEDWEIWKEICEYTGWTLEGKLHPINYRGHILPFNKNLRVGVEIYNEWVSRINQIKAIRMAIVGSAGVGKTYMAIHIARILDKTFTVDQIIFSRENYMYLVRTLKPKKVIILEEPTYIASSRLWYDTHQQIVVRTVESSRFQNNPLLIPIVNRMLLDKTIRQYYLNYVIEMRDRGIGYVYRVSHDQWSDKIYRTKISEIYAYYPGLEIGRCGRTTCLQCKELPTCEKYIWPRYERKREEAILRYQKEDAEKLVTKKESAGEIFVKNCDRAMEILPQLKGSKGRYRPALVMYHLRVNRQDARMIAEFITKEAQKTE